MGWGKHPRALLLEAPSPEGGGGTCRCLSTRRALKHGDGAELFQGDFPMPISHTCTQAGTLLQLLFTQMTEPHRRVYSLRQVSKLAHGTGQVKWLGSCTAACPPADADIVADLLCLL